MQAVSGQDENGWAHFIKGYMSCEWRLRQKELYHSIGSQHTAQSWTEVLLSNILTLINKQWIACDAVVVHTHDKRGLKICESKELACGWRQLTPSSTWM
jgi:hypothetical protein